MNDITNIDKRVGNGSAPERTRGGQTYVPTVDIFETPEKLVLLADVPGATADGIEIHYERGMLTLVAGVKARQQPQTRFLLREYGTGDFVRSFQIGEGIDAERIEAEVNNGVLTLHLPKAAAARTRKIAVKSNSARRRGP